MGFSLFHIMESALLLLNMMAILNERRFLTKSIVSSCEIAIVGWHTTSIGSLAGNESRVAVLKSQIVLIMYAARNFFKCKSPAEAVRAAHNRQRVHDTARGPLRIITLLTVRPARVRY